MSTFALVFVVLWLLGFISSFTVGGFIHVFLAMAIGMMLPRIIMGRKVAEYSRPAFGASLAMLLDSLYDTAGDLAQALARDARGNDRDDTIALLSVLSYVLR